MPFTHNFKLASFDGEQLYITSCQNSPRPRRKLLLIHGLTGDAEAYSELAELLLAKIPRCIVYSLDLRGHGWSSYVFPRTQRDLYQVYVQDIHSICQQLKLDQVVMAGQSLAGMIIQEYINEYGLDSIGGAVLISSALDAPNLAGSNSFWYQRLCLAAGSHMQIRRRLLADHLRFRGSWDYSLTRIASDIYFTQVTKYLLLWLSVLGWKNKHPENLNDPRVLIIAGVQDLVVPILVQRRTHRLLPKALYQEITSNHNAIVNHPEKIAEVMSQFVLKL